jgi:molybdenum cofactor cytidylyltransferase
MRPDRYAAIILAAGLSSRMGWFKPLVSLGGETLVERAVSLFRAGGLAEILVVVGHRGRELRPILREAGVRIVENARFHEGMFSSVSAGVRGLGSAAAAFFLLPVDLPLVRSWTVRRLLAVHEEHSGSIIHPCFRGRRGHPPLIPTDLVGAILGGPEAGGLRAVLARHEERAVNVEVPDRNILFDVNSPAQGEELVDRFRRYAIPTRDECEVILTSICGLPEEAVSRSRLVERVARTLSQALCQAGERLDAGLISAGALLHTLATGQGHDAGPLILDEMGFSPVSRVVAAHTEMGAEESAPVSEREVVYIATTLVQGDRRVCLDRRFQWGGKRLAGNGTAPPEGGMVRKEAVAVRDRLERRLGSSLDAVLQEGELWEDGAGR